MVRRGCGRSRDKSVHDDRNVRRCCPEAYSSHRGYFESANRRKSFEAITKFAAMQRERPLDNIDLVLPPRVIKAGATPSQARGRNSARGCNHGGCRGAVCDAHLTNADQRHASSREIVRDFNTDFDCALCFVARHRGVLQKISRAGTDATVGHARKWIGGGVGFDANIDNAKFVARAPREDTDRGASTRDVAQHFEGDGLGKRADTFIGDSMIGHKNRERARPLGRGTVTADCRITPDHLFQLPEAAGRLSQRVQMRIGNFGSVTVDRANRREGFFQQSHTLTGRHRSMRLR